MLRRVALVRTDVSKELSAPIIKATRIGELRTKLAITSNRRTLLSNFFAGFIWQMQDYMIQTLCMRACRLAILHEFGRKFKEVMCSK
jgi:hypothetical protein